MQPILREESYRELMVDDHAVWIGVSVRKGTL